MTHHTQQSISQGQVAEIAEQDRISTSQIETAIEALKPEEVITESDDRVIFMIEARTNSRIDSLLIILALRYESVWTLSPSKSCWSDYLMVI